MSWVDAAAYTAAEPDPPHPHVAAIVEHMNDDHEAAMVLCCQAFGDRPAATSARMTGIDRYGFDMLARDGQDHHVRLTFDSDITTPTAAAREALVELVQRAGQRAPSWRR